MVPASPQRRLGPGLDQAASGPRQSRGPTDLHWLRISRVCTSLVLLVCTAVGAALGEDASMARPSSADLLPRATMVSSDGAFEISAVSASLGLRGPVMFFAGQFRKDFLHVTQLDPGRVEHPISIRLGGSTNDLRVMGSCVPSVAGGDREWIDIPDPTHADLALLRTALTQALAREWRRALPATADAKPPQDPPAWLLAGVARHIGSEHRLEDLDLVHTQWLHGRLPALAELLSAAPPVALQHPAMQAVLTAWLLDRPGDPLVALLRRLAQGTPWSAALVTETLVAPSSVGSLGEAWDAWQLQALHEVRQLGVTTPGMVRAFRAQLLLYPAGCGLPDAEAWRDRSMADCLVWPITPAVQEALRNKAVELRAYAAGRDGALQRVATAYVVFFEALAKGESSDQLRQLLAQAEAGLKQLETRAEKGEMLHDPREPGKK